MGTVLLNVAASDITIIIAFEQKMCIYEKISSVQASSKQGCRNQGNCNHEARTWQAHKAINHEFS